MRHPKAFILTLFIASLAHGFGGEGHQAVALIAEDRLSKDAKAGIHDLLGKDVDISDAEIASWADQIKRERPKTRPWHYVDIPVNAKEFDRKRDGNKGDNLIDKIIDQQNILADKSQPKVQRAEALKYIVHFVGDLHQPLHCAERDNDSGGNKVDIVFMDREKPSNLHTVWDTDLLRSYVGKTRVADYSSALSKRIKPVDAKKWMSGSVIDWANETHIVAVDQVYKGLPAAGGKYDAKTVKDKQPIVELQLQRAGVRLAEVLNLAFKAK